MGVSVGVGVRVGVEVAVAVGEGVKVAVGEGEGVAVAVGKGVWVEAAANRRLAGQQPDEMKSIIITGRTENQVCQFHFWRRCLSIVSSIISFPNDHFFRFVFRIASRRDGIHRSKLMDFKENIGYWCNDKNKKSRYLSTGHRETRSKYSTCRPVLLAAQLLKRELFIRRWFWIPSERYNDAVVQNLMESITQRG